MRQTKWQSWRLALSLSLGAVILLGLTTSPRDASATTKPALDVSTWTSHQLAAQMSFACVNAKYFSQAQSLAAAGYGGLALIGNGATSHLHAQVTKVALANPRGIKPFIASDEEGGRVQRLKHLIYPLPSAQVAGAHWSASRTETAARNYGQRMRQLGINMNFGPVADLLVPGAFIADDQRAYSSSPRVVSLRTTQWRKGLLSANVIPVVKHWPGHGHARDSHTSAARIPALSILENADMLPFVAQFRAHIPAVMVGHLTATGLTEPGVPASESRNALTYLRQSAGESTVIITDSLSMAAASTSLHRTVGQAAVVAIKNGADMALACSTKGMVTALTTAIDRGSIDRTEAIIKVQRIIALKARFGLIQ